MASMTSPPLSASRMALVAQAMISIAPRPSAWDLNRWMVAMALASPASVIRPSRADHVAQAQGLLVPGQGDEMAVGGGVHHEEVERVRSEVEGGDAHGFPRWYGRQVA